MMEEQENCTRITRASKKRPFGIAMSNSSIHQNVAVPTKRVALGDLTNVPTAAAAVIPSNRQDFTGTKKPKAAHQVKKKTLDNRVEEIRKPEIDVEVRHDDPLEYADAPLIYWHLRMLEVIDCFPRDSFLWINLDELAMIKDYFCINYLEIMVIMFFFSVILLIFFS